MNSQKILKQLKSGQLVGIKRLDLSSGLTEFPREIFDLADSLEILNLSGNQLSSLPADLPRLHKLRIVFCSDNLFTELPSVLGQCKNLTILGFKANQISHVPEASIAPTLRWLILTDNRIQSLPSSIGQCTQMQKLMLAGNQLSELPVGLANCNQLELLRLSANNFATLPSWLFLMPNLAWLTIAGNPMTDAFEAARQASLIISVDWGNIELGSKLGEGASGVIYQAKLHQADQSPKEVAVKLFKSTVTSDGLPRCEITASIAVGLHQNLVGVLGNVSHHPSGAQALLMPLVASDYTNLALPPSLESCTRDVYQTQTFFSLMQLSEMTLGIARAEEHLFAQGVMHGDLYAHNILHNVHGHCLLGDFGAASFVDVNNLALANAMQRIEVRAFGILLGELLLRCTTTIDTDEQILRSKLVDLHQRCTQPQVNLRPLFAQVVQELRIHIESVSMAV